jgi:hypothetical protein
MSRDDSSLEVPDVDADGSIATGDGAVDGEGEGEVEGEEPVNLEARDSDTDEEDLDLAKMRERQAALAAIEREQARGKIVQWLLLKYGVDARHHEYMGYLPSCVQQGVLIAYK